MKNFKLEDIPFVIEEIDHDLKVNFNINKDDDKENDLE